MVIHSSSRQEAWIRTVCTEQMCVTGERNSCLMLSQCKVDRMNSSFCVEYGARRAKCQARSN